MSSRARDLARELSTVNDELLALLERASSEQWRRQTADEGEVRSVGVVAYHVAIAHTRIARRVEAFATGQPVPAREPQLFDARNAQQARDNPEPDQRETLALLQRNGVAAAALVAGLSDAALARTASEDPGAEVLTTEQVIELRLIGHVRSHLATIRSALESA
jgi:parvulin-like peptidyl-prolyl isomerase